MKIVKVLDVKINVIHKSKINYLLENFSNKTKSSLICTPNTEFIVMAQKDQEFKNILNNSSNLNLADGIGVLWAAKFNSFRTTNVPVIKPLVTILQWILSLILIPFLPKYFKNPIPERISGSDVVWDIARFAANNNFKIFLLGGAETIAERVALQLQTDVPNLKIAGVHSGSPKDTDEIIKNTNKSKADIIFVAFGAPKQEKWLDQNLNKTGCKIGIGLGGTFDFVAGTKKRAPLLMQKIGFEWLYRLILEPKRIVRQLSILVFAWLVLINKLKD